MGIGVGGVQKGRIGSGTSQASTGVNTSASGSTFVAGVVFGNSLTFSSIADNMGNSANYVQIAAQTVVDSGDNARLYYVKNGTGGTGHTVTFTFTGTANAITVFFLEITGPDTAAPLDQSGARQDTATPFTLAGGLTTTQAAELLLTMDGGGSFSNPATHTETGLGASTIQTAAEETNGASFLVGAFATQITSSTGTFNPSWTESGNSGGVAVYLATFIQAAAGGDTLMAQIVS